MKIAILGEGAWGTALATVLAENGHQVHLWCHDVPIAKEIEKSRINHQYLPGISLSKNIIPSSDFSFVFHDVDYCIEAIPVSFLRSVFLQAKLHINPESLWIITSKGIEQETGMVPSQILANVCDVTHYAVLAGPSFAKEVAEKQLTAVAIASESKPLSDHIKNLFENDYFLVQQTDDPLGIQLCAAFKNVIALAMGLVDGAGYGDNAKAFVLMQGLHEMQEVVKHYGGSEKTAFGLAGLADTVLTSFGSKSRNRECGRRVGAGESLENVQATGRGVIEGLNTLVALLNFAREKKIVLPFIANLHDVFYKNMSVEVWLQKIKEFPCKK